MNVLNDLMHNIHLCQFNSIAHANFSSASAVLDLSIYIFPTDTQESLVVYFGHEKVLFAPLHLVKFRVGVTPFKCSDFSDMKVFHFLVQVLKKPASLFYSFQKCAGLFKK